MVKLRRKNYATHSPAQTAAYKAALVNVVDGPVLTAIEWAELEQQYQQQTRSLSLHGVAYDIAGGISVGVIFTCLLLSPMAPVAFYFGALAATLLLIEFQVVTPYYREMTHSLGAFSASDFSAIDPSDYAEVQSLIAEDDAAQRYTRAALAVRKDLVSAELTALRSRHTEQEALRRQLCGEKVRENLAAGLT